MWFSYWLCGYAVFTYDSLNAVRREACPECGVSSAFVPLSDDVHLEGDGNTVMDKSIEDEISF